MLNSSKMIIEKLKKAGSIETFPDKKAFYIFTTDDLNNLPENMRELDYKKFKNEFVVYTGITTSLKKRRHLNGTARNSTLRKSLGSLLSLERKYLKENKYRFISIDEERLSKWMLSNLKMYYATEENDLNELEQDLINTFNPPLNINKNYNVANEEFRKYLKELRNKKEQ